jgi:hypothetical protein
MQCRLRPHVYQCTVHYFCLYQNLFVAIDYVSCKFILIRIICWLTTVSVPSDRRPVVETVVLEPDWSRHLLWHIVWNLCNRLGVLHRVSRGMSDEQWRTFPGFINGSIFQHRHSLVHYHILNAEQVTWVAFRPWNSSITCLPSLCQRIWPAMQPEARIAWPRRNSRSSVYVLNFANQKKLRRNLGWRNQARTI